jgi:hypothetical protein
MPVVVNEMEVVPAARESVESFVPAGDKSEPKPLDPRELERAATRNQERCARVRAH